MPTAFPSPELTAAFERAFCHLPIQARAILRARYGCHVHKLAEPLSVAETAAKLGYSRVRIRKIESAALAKCDPERVAAFLVLRFP